MLGAEPVTFTDEWVAKLDGNSERDYVERVAVLECHGCKQRVAVIEEKLIGGSKDGRSGRVSWAGFHWWPTPGGGQLDPSIPKAVADAYGEGLRCLAAGAPHGAVAVLRTALAYVVKDKGSDAAKAKKSLKDQVTQLVRDGGLPASLADWATHIREMGNAGAHPDIFGDVDLDEARDLADLTRQLLEVIYVVPSKIERARAARAPRG
ncbi:DUF4145 domain-containing protein [Micromonospora sp. CPCC 205556]|uniref:DUF4145 domain-containing protein n=1 Tax=Micromonospora sp. CPCC 205556 TaxID=3122398 RepID=UPI002FF1110E